jgi:hypothetical protein
MASLHPDLSDALVRTPSDRSPLEAAEDAFLWLVTGPRPLAVEGGHLPGLPNRRLPLHKLRARLLAQRLRPTEVDTLWAHLVFCTRTAPLARRPGWTIGCVGVAMPVLARTAASLSMGYPGDPADVEAAVLAGFVTELHCTDVCIPNIPRRLRVAADRAGRAVVDTLTSRQPSPTPATTTATTATTPATARSATTAPPADTADRPQVEQEPATRASTTPPGDAAGEDRPSAEVDR